MPSHFSDIGIKDITEENYVDKIKELVDGNIRNAVRIALNDSPYLVVPIDNLIELWFPFDNNTLNPYEMRLHYQTSAFLEVEDASWTDPEKGGSEDLCSMSVPDCYPLNVTVPAPKLTIDFEEKKRYMCQVACFAESFDIYEDADDFHSRSENGDKLGDQCYIPFGQFQDEEDSELSSRALINGVIKNVEKRINGYTKEPYYLLTVDSFGARYEVLADTDSFDTEPQTGNVISGEFWLSGKFTHLFKGDELKDLERIKQGGDPRLRTIGDLFHILRECWSKETAYPTCQSDWSRKDRTFGQCAVTAMLVCDLFGGTIHKIRNDDGSTHYFNKLNGQYVDLTSEQFELYFTNVDYEKSIPVDRSYCGKNPDTKKRYDRLINNVSEYLRSQPAED